MQNLYLFNFFKFYFLKRFINFVVILWNLPLKNDKKRRA